MTVAHEAQRVERPMGQQTPAQTAVPAAVGPLKPGNYADTMKSIGGLAAQSQAVKPAPAEDSAELKAFKSQKHELENFNSPTTKLGLFDLAYDPATNVATVTTRLNYAFKDGNANDYTSAKPEELAWTDADKKTWKTGFTKIVTDAWSGRFAFSCTKKGFESVRATVAVSVLEVEKDWHFQLTVNRIPKDEFHGSSVSTYGGSNARGVNYADLDSEDLTGVTKRSSGKTKQVGAAHEFGHMLGLGDEYEASNVTDGAVSHSALVKNALGTEVTRKDTDDIMSCGANVGRQHYVTILEALKQATSIPEWAFEEWTGIAIRMAADAAAGVKTQGPAK